MANTIIPRGSALAVRKFGVKLTISQPRKTYYERFTGHGEDTDMPVMELLGLEADQGDTMDYQLVGAPQAPPIEGGAPRSGTEELIIENSCEIHIDILSHGIDCGRKMTRKRSKHDLRKIGVSSSGPYWARVIDELCSMYISGHRGDNDKFLFSKGYTGFAGNTITAPDANHLRKVKSTYAAFGSGDVLTLAELNNVKTIVDMLGVDVNGVPEMLQTSAEGTECFIYLMSKFGENDLKSASSGNTWLDLQKSLISNLGEKADIVKGSIGWYNGFVLHSHQKVIRFSAGTDPSGGTDYLTVPASRNMVLGKQALTIAWGTKGNKGVRYGWNEFYDDHGTKLVIDTDCCLGVTKNTYGGYDYGSYAHDVAAASP